MNSRSSLFRPLLTLAVVVAVIGSVGCEKNMGSTGGNDGWTKVSTTAEPAKPLPKADAVNVTYFYLPG